MSRLAKKPIIIPEKTTVTITEKTVSVKGPLGTLTRTFSPAVDITTEADGMHVALNNTHRDYKALLGTTVAHIKNMVVGVNTAYTKKLIIEGVGYKADAKGQTPVRRDERRPFGRVVDDGLVATRELERTLVGLAARVAEEHAVGERVIDDRLRREDLLLVVVEVRDVDEARELRRDPLGEGRMGVAEPAHRDARGHVEEARACDVPHLATAGAREHDRLRLVVLEENLISEGKELGLRHHAGCTTHEPGQRSMQATIARSDMNPVCR